MNITPSPWDIIEARSLLHIETANDGSGKPCGMAVCSLPKSHLADARLIAAAPELLAACKALLEVSLQGGAEARYQARADAIEAIAKAEGRKPDFLTDSERALIAARDEFRKK